eukprot:6357098-Amphidinium_carterae.1
MCIRDSPSSLEIAGAETQGLLPLTLEWRLAAGYAVWTKLRKMLIIFVQNTHHHEMPGAWPEHSHLRSNTRLKRKSAR